MKMILKKYWGIFGRNEIFQKKKCWKKIISFETRKITIFSKSWYFEVFFSTSQIILPVPQKLAKTFENLWKRVISFSWDPGL